MRTIKFGGFEWNVKDSRVELVGPGPNYFTNDSECIFVDEHGLHLKTRQNSEGKWECTEAVLNKPLGFGEYSFSLSTPLHDLEKNMVFAGFLYENDTQEIDIEFSEAMAGTHGAQYVVQPGWMPGNLKIFEMSAAHKTHHSIIWTSESVEFKSFEDNGKEIASWKYNSAGITSPDRAVFIFNLWLYSGKKPKHAEEAVIKKFTFTQP